jgi:hypothetical protein
MSRKGGDLPSRALECRWQVVRTVSGRNERREQVRERHMPTLPEKANTSVTGLRLPTGGPQTSLAQAPQPQSGESPGGKETVEVVPPEAISTGPKDGSTSGAAKAHPPAGRPPTPTVRRSSSIPCLLYIILATSVEAGTEVIRLDARLCSDFDQESGIGICC